MELIEYHGINIVLTDCAEAVSRDWRWYSGPADVVRVDKPDPQRYGELSRHGFAIKPQFVTWTAKACESEEEYLAGLTGRERQRIRAARSRLRAEGLSVRTRAIDPVLVDRFLVLYRSSVGRIRHGVLVACEEREAVLADRDSYFAVCVMAGGDLVGCCLAQLDEPAGTVRVRFSAVDAPHREASLARVLYLEAAQQARARGLATFSLGKDRNLYGHIAKPGLLRFKRQLGLRPHPSHFLNPAVGHDQADLIVGFQALADPAMILRYPGETASDDLALEVFTTRPGPDIRAFENKFAGAIAITYIDGGLHDNPERAALTSA